jgi:hypothetical protein
VESGSGGKCGEKFPIKNPAGILGIVNSKI